MLMDTGSGEIIGDKFAKMFFNDIGLLFGLSGTDIKLLFLMVKSVGLGNVNSLKMFPKRKKEYAAQLNLKTHIQITSSLQKMCNLGIIKKSDPTNRFDYEYIINPRLFFSGNDYQMAKILIDYEGGSKEIKVFKNKESLKEFMDSK